MNKIKVLLLSGVLAVGLTFGVYPVSTFAKTTTKSQAQNNLKKQTGTYISALNKLKNEIKSNDSNITYEYNTLQSNIKLFTKYNYTGLNGLKSKSSNYKTKLNKLRKDNASVDMKKISVGFNSYIKKNNSKGAKSYYTVQKAKLVSILMKQDDLLYDMMDYNENLYFQIEEENEIYIYNALPIEQENLELEFSKFYGKMIEVMQKEEEVEAYSYKVLNVNYTIKQQIRDDLEKLENSNNLGEGAFFDDMNLHEYIQKRDIENARKAMIQYTLAVQAESKNIDKIMIELENYKQNLTTIFKNNVKSN